MKNWYQRRAFPAMGDVGAAEIVDHRDLQRRAQRRAVAELHGQALLRPVQHRLPVKSHNIDAGERNPILCGKSLDAFGVLIREHAFRQRKDAAAVVAAPEPPRGHHRLAQKVPLGRSVWKLGGRSESVDRLPVRLDQCHIDAIHRGAAH